MQQHGGFRGQRANFVGSLSPKTPMLCAAAGDEKHLCTPQYLNSRTHLLVVFIAIYFRYLHFKNTSIAKAIQGFLKPNYRKYLNSKTSQIIMSYYLIIRKLNNNEKHFLFNLAFLASNYVGPNRILYLYQ